MAGYSARLGEPVETDTATLYWMDWSGPDVLKVLESDDPRVGKIDSINWGITNSEAFEKVKRHAQGRVLCVTGKHPDDEQETNNG